MIVSILLGIVRSLVVKTAVHFLWNWIKDKISEMPEKLKTELSETDKKKAEETAALIHDKFGEDVVATVAAAGEEQRVEMMADFTKELAVLYGLDIDIVITATEDDSWGQFNAEENKVVFNFAALMTDATQEDFKNVVFEIIDTIVHELRHAVQHKAISDPNFWDIGKKRAKIWSANMRNYIRAGVDPKGHSIQPVEADAATFANQVMNEVK